MDNHERIASMLWSLLSQTCQLAWKITLPDFSDIQERMTRMVADHFGHPHEARQIVEVFVSTLDLKQDTARDYAVNMLDQTLNELWNIVIYD